ncbi:hypothetical protein Q5752_000972 [Cryptotrichosporon argae]
MEADDHSAGVVLRQYVVTHWYKAADDFVMPETPDEVKAQIREQVVAGLASDVEPVRSVCAQITSRIASYDWPEAWPALLPQLVAYLQRGEAHSTHGVMSVVGELVNGDLGEDQAVPVVKDLAPALLGVLRDQQTHSTRVRAMAAIAFRHILSMLNTLKHEYLDIVRQALEATLKPWLAAFALVLDVDAGEEVERDWDSVALRIEVFTCLMNIWGWFPKAITSSAQQHITFALSTLTSLSPAFHRFYIDSADDAPSPPEPEARGGDAGPSQTHIDQLASTVFEMLEPLTRSDRVRLSEERGVVEGIVALIITYTQITREEEEEWIDNVNAFVEDEDEDNGGLINARMTGIDLMDSMVEKWGRTVIEVLAARTQVVIDESARARQAGNIDWWKPLEAALRLIGGISNDLQGQLEDDKQEGRAPCFDLESYFAHVIPSLLQQSDTPFLQGRAYIFASRFARLLSPELASQYLDATVRSLGSDSAMPVQISALRTVQNFCQYVDPAIVAPRVDEVLGVLFAFLPHAVEESLVLSLDTALALVAVDKAHLTPERGRAIAEQVYAQYLKHSSNPIVTSTIHEIVESLVVASPATAASVVGLLATPLADMISAVPTPDTLHLPTVAIELTNALVRPRQGPLEDVLIERTVAAIIARLIGADDADEVQQGMLVLTLVVRKDCDKLIALHDPAFGSGLDGILAVVSRVLDPASNFSESAGVFVGDLVMHLFRKAGPVISAVLPNMLGALARRLALAELPFFKEALVVPFAYLCGAGYAAETLGLLADMTVRARTDDGWADASALAVVLRTWCEAAETISGSWNLRVHDIGLAKLFELPPGPLAGVTVKGDLIIDDITRNTIMTRSKAKKTPPRYSQIPFPLKALKLLLKDVQAMGKKAGTGAGKQTADDLVIEDDDGDDEWADDDPLTSGEPDEFAFLSDWLDSGKDGVTDEDDEDLKADPLAQYDLGQYLSDTLRAAYASNANGIHEMVAGLTESEKGALKNVLSL